MKRLFYIEEEKFLRDMFELTAKNEELDCYTVESSADCFYLIKDLQSELIIIDIKTVSPQIDEFFANLEKEGLSQIPVVAVGRSEDIEEFGANKSKVLRIIEKPLPATGLFDKILGKAQ
jgi:DNA-binding NtrC family response regulator